MVNSISIKDVNRAIKNCKRMFDNSIAKNTLLMNLLSTIFKLMNTLHNINSNIDNN